MGKWIDKPRREYVLAREPYLHQCRDCVPNRGAGCGIVDRAWLDLLAFVAWLITIVLGHELSKENAKWEYVSFVYFLYVSACVAYYFLYKVPKKEFVGGIFWEDDVRFACTRCKIPCVAICNPTDAVIPPRLRIVDRPIRFPSRRARRQPGRSQAHFQILSRRPGSLFELPACLCRTQATAADTYGTRRPRPVRQDSTVFLHEVGVQAG